MENFISAYDKFVNAITKLVGVIAGALILYTAFAIVFEVLCRTFHTPTEWVMEISTYCVVIAGFLGMGVTYAGKKHIHVELVINNFSAKTRCYIEVLTCIAAIFYSFIFTVEAWDMTMRSLEYNNCAPTTLGTPLWIPQISMPIGMAVLVLQIIRTLLIDINKIMKDDFGEEVEK
ncbi:MAG: TRAP transporter small permease [Phascolarctobacterium sp.]|nr:TRAP transporter small permease [Phascolarctobacterium sp.]